MVDKETLEAIAKMMDEKLAVQTAEIKEFIRVNNVAIGEIVTEIVERSHQKIIDVVKSINEEFKPVIAQNCIDITKLRSKAL